MNPNYLSDREQAAVISFNENPTMKEAVRKVLLACIYHQGTVSENDLPTPFNFAFSIVQSVKSDEQIGQELRASVTALNYLQAAFERLSEVTKEEPKKKKGNPAV